MRERRRPAMPRGSVVHRRRADRRTGPPRPHLAFRTGRRPLLLHRAAAPSPRPHARARPGHRRSHRRRHRPGLRSALAQRPDARRRKKSPASWCSSSTAAPSPASASTSTTPPFPGDLRPIATSLRARRRPRILARATSGRAAARRRRAVAALRTPETILDLFTHASSYAAGTRVDRAISRTASSTAPPRASTPPASSSSARTMEPIP